MSEPQRRELEAMFDTYLCPDCGHGLVFLPGPPSLLHCNICEKDFFTPQESHEEDHVNLSPMVPSAELNRLHVAHLATMRRALYRSRSYAIVAAFGCAGVVLQLTWLTIRHVRDHGWELRPVSFLACILLGMIAAIWFVRRAMALTREAHQSKLTEPSAPPDFSSLSDGSQHAQNLDKIQ